MASLAMTRRGERRVFLSPRLVSPFSRGVIFKRARVSLALLSLRKTGTTRSLMNERTTSTRAPQPHPNQLL